MIGNNDETGLMKNFKAFETMMSVRPDDIDMNQHVHNSRYLDYVLHARYIQMRDYYNFPMEEFLEHGYGWVVKSCWIEYKRPLLLGDEITIRNRILEMNKSDVKLQFEILRNKTGKLAAGGHFLYTMINMRTGRAEVIPDWVVERYSL
jgi:YbgC/YbaW family acyl-CoA thioester hydrolase